jgi:two-component system nitrogen regulation sensor histidine kinase NtrY
VESRRKVLTALGVFLVILIVGYFGVSFVSSLAGEFYLNNPIFHVLFALILIILTILFVFFIRNLALFFFPQFKTNIKVKIFTAFLLLILGPALFSILLASGIINKGLDRLLRIQVSRIVNTSNQTVDEFLNFISKDLERKLNQLSGRKGVYPYTLKAYGIDGFLKKGTRFYKVGDFPLTEKEVSQIEKLERYTFLEPDSHQLVVCKRRGGNFICVSRYY